MSNALAYVPVLHEGYRRFIARNAQGGVFYLVGQTLTAGFKPIEKEIRALEPELIARAVEKWGLARVVVVEKDTIAQCRALRQLVVADEDITREIVSQHLAGVEVEYDPVFLRWDRHRTLGVEEPRADEVVTADMVSRRLMEEAASEASKSSDWWRHVGAVLVCADGTRLVARNDHVPSPHTPYSNGDPRNNFSRGVHLELSTSEHAEASIIAEAARRGIAVEGSRLYTTAFPCPPCARLIVHAGVSELYFSTGYAVLDGESVMKYAGVKIVRVQHESPPTS